MIEGSSAHCSQTVGTNGVGQGAERGEVWKHEFESARTTLFIKAVGYTKK